MTTERVILLTYGATVLVSGTWENSLLLRGDPQQSWCIFFWDSGYIRFLQQYFVHTTV